MTERQRGLGRGLSALLEEATAEQPVAPPTAPSAGGVRHLPIELIRANADQPRKHFDADELQSLADSIRARGVIQPIIVRPRKGADNEFEIVAGERRWRAAQLAGLHQMPVIVRTLGDTEVSELAMIENVQRADLNPVEEAMGYQVLQSRGGYNQNELAQIVGKSRSHVTNTLRILDMPQQVRDHLIAGRLTAGHARAIASAADPGALADKIVAGGLNVRQAEALAAAPTARAERKPGAQKASNADTLALEQDLAEALGLEVALKDRGGKGEITVRYATLEQLDEICRRLMRGDRHAGV
ncbi:MAG: ParB/RepB/Spo0J family partition protein [Caulobacteraceae bacterium]|nr:ParB/RepB/Spo0J family partition protein [Caulobacteraceae bacterium]